MSICRQERYQILQQAQQQIQRASTTYLQQCETFSDRIDNWVQGWSNQCSQVPVQRIEEFIRIPLHALIGLVVAATSVKLVVRLITLMRLRRLQRQLMATPSMATS